MSASTRVGGRLPQANGVCCSDWWLLCLSISMLLRWLGVVRTGGLLERISGNPRRGAPTLPK